jgi:hypothetical protein
MVVESEKAKKRRSIALYHGLSKERNRRRQLNRKKTVTRARSG